MTDITTTITEERCEHGNTYWHIIESSLYIYDHDTEELDWVWCRGVEPTFVSIANETMTASAAN